MNASLCPLCGEENHCHMATGKDPMSCWCTKRSIPEGLLLLLPEEAKGLACICEACVRAYEEKKLPVSS